MKSLDDSSENPTGIAPSSAAPAPSGTPRRTPSSPSSGASRISTSGPGRFAPGELIADRYRIVGLLGRGGMGEVYRADDLKLEQPVALKFLPEALQRDPELLARFYNEVRMARQVSHAAVCRVHDIGEVEGTAFLSMEFVDGEDLAFLLKRIGRLPGDKAIDVARQISAGLAAAHARGVLHRDLKPANIMLDGEGRARITDFGLAGLADSLRGADTRSGTPAYMSPEQLEGREVTARSDVYALGLVLYELVTGRRAFDGRSLGEILRQREMLPPRPMELAPDMDPRLDAVIWRCLERDPSRRPGSALMVAAMLPGGDPLAAALAEGQTPSPEMIAAAGEAEERMRPEVAWAMLAAVAAVLATVPLVFGSIQLLSMLPPAKPIAVLEDRARELARSLGYRDAPADSEVGMAIDADYFRHVAGTDASPTRWSGLATGRPAVLQFYYRQSPRPLVPSSLSGQISWNDPPLLVSGMVSVRFDMQGRLLQFLAVPPQVDAGGQSSEDFADWSPLFAASGLDPARFTAVASSWTPPFDVDSRVAWEGSFEERSDIPIRVEAAAHRGRPAAFYIVAPWTRPERDEPFTSTMAARVSNWTLGLLLFGLIAAAAILARRHLRSGRGDRRGSVRVAMAAFGLGTLRWALGAHHVASGDGEVGLFVGGLASVLFLTAVVWLFYVALEPFVRRLWPHALISWTRLLGRGPKDALVARDVLVGIAAGSGIALLILVAFWLPRGLGQPAPEPVWNGAGVEALLGWRSTLAVMLQIPLASAVNATATFLALVLLRLLLRREWAAASVLVAVLGITRALGTDLPLLYSLPMWFMIHGSLVTVALRFGLLAYVVAGAVIDLLLTLPATGDLTDWTAAPMRFVFVVVLALAVWAFRTARAPAQSLSVETAV
jgi:serine/threonine-protein kinase